MSRLIFNRDGGKTDEFGHLLGLARSMQGEVIEGLLVAANGSPNMTVNVPIGTAMIPTSSGGTAYKYFVGLDATESVAITTANPSNPRNDLIVMYVDIAVTPSQSFTNNSNSMLKLVAVAGTPAASPADPSVANIQAAIGAANPYIILARVAVGAGVTQINSGNITDLRSLAQPLRVGGASIVNGTVVNSKIANSTLSIDKMDYSTWPKFSAYPSTAASTVVGQQKVTLNLERYDVGSNFNNSRFVAPVTGFYTFSGGINMASVTPTRMFLSLQKNGVELMRGADIAASCQGTNLTATLQLAAGDYVELWLYVNIAGGSYNGNFSYFEGTLIAV